MSLSAGRPGAMVNVGSKGVKATVGLPGTGLSYSTMLAGPDDSGEPIGLGAIALIACGFAFVAFVAFVLFSIPILVFIENPAVGLATMCAYGVVIASAVKDWRSGALVAEQESRAVRECDVAGSELDEMDTQAAAASFEDRRPENLTSGRTEDDQSTALVIGKEAGARAMRTEVERRWAASTSE